MSNHNVCIKGTFESLDISVKDKPALSLILLDVERTNDFPIFKSEYSGTHIIIDVVIEDILFERILCKANPWKFTITDVIKFAIKANTPIPFDIFKFTEIHDRECEIKINTKPTPAEIAVIVDPLQSKLAKFEK